MNHAEQPTHTNKIMLAVIFVSVSCGILLFVAAMYQPSLPAVTQLVGVAFMTVGIALVGHYQTRYTYRVEDDPRGGDGHDFVVVQMRGRREIVVCRLGLEDVREIEHQTPENRSALKKKHAEAKDEVHSYCVDLLPAESQYLRFDDGGNRVVIRLQASDALISLFEAALPN